MPSGSIARPRRAGLAASDTHLPETAKAGEDGEAKCRFVLQVIKPGLAGLTDGTVSTLTPAFAAHNLWNAFLVGLVASLDAGISMGFAKALKGDGKLSGRGTPLTHGLMTVANGIGHTVPYLIPNFVTVTAAAAALFELLAIAWIPWRFMETLMVPAAHIMFGGGLVLATGIVVGNAG